MGQENDMTLNLPTEVVERAVRDKISAAIASQLGDPEILIAKLVGNALSQKVNAQGKVSSSSYENKNEFLETLAGNFIRESAQEALREFFEDNKKAIKEAVKKEVAKSPSKMAKVFMDGITYSMKSNYTSNVTIEFKTNREY